MTEPEASLPPEGAEPASAHPSRRDFARTLAVAAAAPLLASVGACMPAAPPARPAPDAAPAAAPPAVAPDTARAGESAKAPDPVAVAMTEVIRLKYGSRLSAADLEKIREGIEGNLGAARALRAFPLPISTEPAFVFRAYRGGER